MIYILTVIARALAKSINLITFVLLVRLLVVDDFAKYGMVFNTALLLAIFFDLGYRNSIAFYVQKSLRHAKKILPFVVSSYFIFSSVLYLALFFAPDYMKLNFFQEKINTVFLIVIGFSLIRTIQGFFIGVDRVTVVNYSEILQKSVLATLIVAIFIFEKRELTLVLYALLGSIFSALSYLVICIIKHFKNSSISSSSQNIQFESKSFITRGLFFMVAAFFMLAYKKAGFYMTSAAGTDELAGAYFAISRLGEIITEFAVAISMVLFAKSMGANERKESISLIAKTLRMSHAFIIFVLVFLIMFSSLILEYGLGTVYGTYSPLYVIILFASFFGLVPTMIFPTLTVLYPPIKVAALYFAILGTHLLSGLLMFELFSVNGIALSLLLNNLILTSIIVLLLKKREGTRFSDLFFINRNDIDFLTSKINLKLG